MLLPLRTMHLSRSLPLAAIFALTLWLFAQADGPNPPADDTATPAAETPTTEATAQLDAVELERQVRPLLSDTCFLCHGFDSTSRVTGMRLDTAEGPFEDLAGYQAVVPGDREMSELWRRINSDDDFERMPPVDSGRQLTPEQIELIGQWIDAGAPWHGHWAFLPPERAGLPSVDNAVWCNNEIDRFILAELEQHGLAPSPEADRATLIRRVTLDLTGLPPTLEEIDAFLADDSPDAYEQLVDRLLASPRYGEFMAIPWLDAARYSDTLGYQADLTADMWPWRDGLIDALNTNQPFDQFTLEQLAGDMLPGATLEQQIASAFNRLHMTNNEGGAIPEESRVEYVINRLETTGATWLGMTVGCSRCHDHKYDPLTQREFYQLTGYFNNVEETGRVDGPITGTAAPTMGVPSDDQRLELAQLEAEFAILERQLTSPPAEFAAEQAAWEAEQALDSPWQVLAPQSFESTGGATLTALEDDSLLASGEDPPFDTYHVSVLAQPGTITALRLEALPHESLPQGNTGRNAGGNFVLNQFTVEVAPTDAAAQPVAFARAAADYSQNGHDPQFLITQPLNKQGWAVDGHVAARRGRRKAIFQLAEPLELHEPTQLRITLTHDSNWAHHNIGRFRLAATGTSEPLRLLDIPDDVLAALATPLAERDAAAAQLVTNYAWQRTPANEPLRQELAVAVARREEINRNMPVVLMIMREREERRPTYVLPSGTYDEQGDEIEPGVPAFLPPLPAGAANNRLGLAQWLVSGEHPLTARVVVNRYWQQYFGTGLVKTSEDFGVQGDPPSHPELLDWLACEFENDWNVKRLHRLLVTSAAYRQSSRVTPEILEIDPNNRLLTRGPRHRLNSLAIRDQALALAGMLIEEQGGPPVRPYQPAGVWAAFSLDQITYEQQHGENLYRRSVYTFWRRSVGPTNLFDTPNRQQCVVRQARTNTPLHSLVIWNDVTYVEAGRLFAERMMREGGDTPAERIAWAFRCATARQPNDRELAVLTAAYERTHAAYEQDHQAALALLDVGEFPSDPTLDAVDLAAYTGVASIILNLDETISKE